MNLAPTKNPITRWLYRKFALWIAQWEAMKTQLDGHAWTRAECRHCHKWIETDADAVFCPRCGLRLSGPVTMCDIERVTPPLAISERPLLAYLREHKDRPDGPQTRHFKAVRKEIRIDE